MTKTVAALQGGEALANGYGEARSTTGPWALTLGSIGVV